MIDRDDLIDELHQLTRKQVELAVIAPAGSVAAMHIDLALFGAEQARFAETSCEDGWRPVAGIRSPWQSKTDAHN